MNQMQLARHQCMFWVCRAAFGLLSLLFAVSGRAQPDESVRITIDPTVTHQTIDGFGASGCWWPTWFDRLSADTQERALDLLFTNEGAGLSIFRWNIPSASGDDVTNPRRRTPDIETQPNQYDLGPASQSIDVLERVIARGVNDIVLFANSPPRRLTRNGRTSGGDRGGSNLAKGREAEFARYLVDVAELVMERVGLERARLSPINEPQWRWGEEDRRRWQEGCHYTPTQARDVLRAVLSEINARTGTAAGELRLEAFDSGSWQATIPYAEVIWGDPQLGAALDEISIHSYWSDAETKASTRAWIDQHLPGVKIVQAEYCEMRPGHDPGMRSALHVARVIHEDLTIGGVSEWTWWLALSSSRFCDGLIHGWPATGEIEVTKRLWALAHWSRFVEPGWVRIACETSDDALLVSAFASPGGDAKICVVINPTSEAIPVVFPGLGKPGAHWLTDETNNLAAVERLHAAPPKSVMTLRWPNR